MELEDGFLDLKLNEVVPLFRHEHQSEYLIIFKVKSFLDELQNTFVGNIVSKRDIFLYASILELSKLFQSAVLLFERGLSEAAKIVIRSILELSFKIIELTRNENFMQEMILDVSSESLATLIKMKESGLYDFIIDKNCFDELLNDFQKVKAKSSKVNIRASELAKRNGLENEYILYRTYCGYTHLSAQVIDELIEINPDGVILNGDFRLDDFSESIAMLASITMISFSKILQYLTVGENLKNQFDLLQDDFVKVFKHRQE